jgi:carboxymethylenebutenolidase
MIEKQIEITTAAGRMSTFICHPERGGPHPALIFFMDAPGIREELRDMARRFATVGYYVLLPNLYYRFQVEELGPFVGNPAVRAKFLELMGRLSIPMIMEDTDALMDFLKKEEAASKGPIGCVGYCMSGQYAINAAARYPDRIAAAASIYGTRLITDQPDSPHLAARKATKTKFYAACAEIDDYVPVEMIHQFRESLHQGGVKAEVEFYPGVGHGFAFPGRPAYNKDAAERHWERLFALFATAVRAC